MRTAFFSRRSTRQSKPRRDGVARPPDPDRLVLEQQQALLLEVLRRAGGTPVSYAELNDAGVEFPASVVSELELGGVEFDRCFGGGTGSRRMLGVRLVPADRDREPVGATATTPRTSDVPRPAAWGPVRVYRTTGARILVEGALAGASRLGTIGRNWARRAAAGRPAIGSRMLAPLALLAAAGVVGAVVLSALPGSGGAGGRPAGASSHPPAIAARHVIAVPGPKSVPGSNAGRASTPSTPAGATTTTSTSTIPTSTTPAPATTTPITTPTASTSSRSTAARQRPAPVSPALAGDLEARGHDLMVAGHYDRAVPVLERTLQATGEKSGACVEPTTRACLTYAFALYDLGRSLRLAGHPAAAVAILERRLRIDNQRPVVAADLAQARKQAGQRTG